MSAQPPRRTLAPAPRKLTPAHSSHCQQMAGLYDLEETLGKGHFATVKAARHVFTGERVAVKVIEKSKLSPNHTKGLLKEVLCMKLVQHPHVVRLYEVIDTSSKMYLVLELGVGDLYDIIQKQQPSGLDTATARRYFNQILSAVSYCHKLHVAHRDLKPENVVYFNTGGGCVKLTDFGFSNHFEKGVKLDTSCGSLCYSAPEILLGDSYDAPAVDIWSLGVILFMLVAGHAPFQEANDSETLTMIMDVKYSFPASVDQDCRRLIGRMLVRAPEERAGLEEIQSEPWLEGCEEIGDEVLMTGRELNESGRRHVIDMMIQGGVVAAADEVTSALSSNAYNYITSTYYLLAEKYLKERLVPAEPSLTSSLESLHDKRKNSGISSDTDTPSDEDSLAGLDLETGFGGSAGSKIKPRFLGGIDFERTIVEEEDEDAESEATPLATTHRTTHRIHHRIYHRPQRSASCSSSEDEERTAEKKKQKSKQSHKPDELHFRDEDEDEGGAAGGMCPPAAGASGSAASAAPVVPPPAEPAQQPSASTTAPTSRATTALPVVAQSSAKNTKKSIGKFFQWFFHKTSSVRDSEAKISMYKSKSCADLKRNGVRTDFNMNL